MTREEAELYPEWTRKITERKKLDDVSDELTLDCGHEVTLICPPAEVEYMQCAQCLHDWIEAEKAKR